MNGKIMIKERCFVSKNINFVDVKLLSKYTEKKIYIKYILYVIN